MSEAPPQKGLGGESATGRYVAQAAGGSTAMVAVFQAAATEAVEPADVATAEALLAALPVDPLPEPGGLPLGSVMPWVRNRFFVGREPDLEALIRQLKEGGAAAVGQSPAVTGLGRQGKTQLAVELAYRCGRWFTGGVFWVSCADPASIPEAVAACGSALFAVDAGFSARPLPERIAMVASAWAGPLPRLLIFDNCEDEAILDDWAPKSGGCRLLLTARHLSWSPARGITAEALEATFGVPVLVPRARDHGGIGSMVGAVGSAWSPARGITAVPLGQLARRESLTLLHRHRPDLRP